MDHRIGPALRIGFGAAGADKTARFVEGRGVARLFAGIDQRIGRERKRNPYLTPEILGS